MKVLRFYVVGVMAMMGLHVSFAQLLAQQPLYKEVLSNGLTVLVKPMKTAQKVSVQLWYQVGSKHEQSGERGLAHLIEHMIFKGTDQLTESDIPMVTHKLSGWCNAATSYDWTVYFFNFPAYQWQHALPIMADCMRNCTFKQDLLNAEFKTVIQELKMRRDTYARDLFEKVMASVFTDHPYHYPIIGFKQDLWTVNQPELLAFYKKQYVPNNATMVIVGDVDVQDTMARVRKEFGSIPADPTHKQPTFYRNKDVAAHSVTLYRDVKQPQCMFSYVIPGARLQTKFSADVLSHVLTGGKTSRLHTKLVEELQLCNWVSSYNVGLFDYDLFTIHAEPREAKHIKTVALLVQEELDAIARDGITRREFEKALSSIQIDFYRMLESTYDQARGIGQFFLATGDEHALYRWIVDDYAQAQSMVMSLVSEHMPACVRNQGLLLPLSDADRQAWVAVQQRSDEEDAHFLAQKERQSAVEEGKYVHRIEAGQPQAPAPVIPNEFTLSNGLKVLSHQHDTVPMVTFIMRFEADEHYDSEKVPGLYRMLCYMMREGTQKYTGVAFADELESRGITLSISPGQIRMTMRSIDVQKSLELLYQVLACATIPEKELAKVRMWMLADYHRFWDSPNSVLWDKISEYLYRGHPFSKKLIGTPESLHAITREDLVSWYKQCITPRGTTFTVVGDLRGVDVKSLLEQSLGSWKGETVKPLVYPQLKAASPTTVVYPMNRDQIVLGFAGHSVNRFDPDYDAMVLFDQIFGVGMNSRLFHIREKYGIFYTVSGSLVSGACKQPGLVTITATVSKDRVALAERLILEAVDTSIDTITESELEEAKRMLIQSMSERYATGSEIANTLNVLDDYQFPFDYYVRRVERIKALTLGEVQHAARRVLRRDALSCFKVGRQG